jgi:hypothetical protein
MTEIAIRESRNAAELLRRAESPSLEAWAEEMAAAAQIARGIAGTPFVPGSLRVLDHNQIDLAATTANVAATLLTGKEVGLEPMAALRSIVVINGTPAINALAARALVIARGHELWLVESTKTRCIYQGRRHGSDRTQESVWTIDRAKDLGLAGKPNWRQQPIAMLIARATAECARLVAPEVLLGLPYIVEELEDQGGEPASEPAENPETPRRTAQRRRRASDAPPPPPTAVPSSAEPAAAAVPEDDPPLDDDTAPVIGADQDSTPQPDPPAEPDPPLITREQSKALHAALRAVGAGKRADGLALIAAITGREVESTGDMWRAEASTVIDELRRREQALAQADEDAALELAYEHDMAQRQQSGDEPDPS